MLRRLAAIGLGSVLFAAVGCQNMGVSMSPVVGTWSARGQADDAPFSFGSVSFVGDKTFTAEAKYGGQSRVQSGSWATKGNELMLTAGDTKRSYTYKMEGGNLIVTEPKSGHSVTLVRNRAQG